MISRGRGRGGPPQSAESKAITITANDPNTSVEPRLRHWLVNNSYLSIVHSIKMYINLKKQLILLQMLDELTFIFLLLLETSQTSSSEVWAPSSPSHLQPWRCWRRAALRRCSSGKCPGLFPLLNLLTLSGPGAVSGSRKVEESWLSWAEASTVSQSALYYPIRYAILHFLVMLCLWNKITRNVDIETSLMLSSCPYWRRLHAVIYIL